MAEASGAAHSRENPMSSRNPITFVVSVNNTALFKDNFLASPCLGQLEGHEILVQEGFSSAAKAYNDALDRAANDLIVFCHQDILLPEPWMCQLQRALDQLEVIDPKWGVLG